MSTNSRLLEDIVYKLADSRNKNKPGAIVFLGAGASLTAGIPLTGKIIDDIRSDFAGKRRVTDYFQSIDDFNQDKSEADKKKYNYYEIMDCLDGDEIKELFSKYVRDAKLNVAHIYLASMINEGYVDYVVTVNFDNLMQRALALYSKFPSVHDVTLLKEKVTDTIDIPAVIHVHGQYNGNFQLNKKGELEKVKDMTENIFAKISQNRTCIVVGYSGEDPVFDNIFSSTKFDKNLYWICYKEQPPSQAVQDKLINKVEFNASCVNGYDADTFFMKLHNSLKINEPHIYTNPFQMLETYLEKVVDITGEEFAGVNERLRISRERVKLAISLYNRDAPNLVADQNYQSAIEKDNYALKLSEIVSSKNFAALKDLHAVIIKVGLEDELKQNISDAYFSWGYDLGEKNKYEEAIEKYKIVLSLNDKSDVAYNNWGVMYDRMKKLEEALPYYQKAIDSNPGKAMYYNNMGSCLDALGRFAEAEVFLKEGISKEPDYPNIQLNYANVLYSQKKYEQAIAPYQKAIAAEPGRADLYYCLGGCLYYLKKYNEAAEQYKKVLELEPDNPTIHKDLGNALFYGGAQKEALEVFKAGLLIHKTEKVLYTDYGSALANSGQYKEAEKQYQEALKIDPLYTPAYNGLGHALNKDGRKQDALIILQKGESIREGSCLYNLSCGYALSGEKRLSLASLEKFLKNEKLYEEDVPRKEIEADEDFASLHNDPEFKILLDTYKPVI